MPWCVLKMCSGHVTTEIMLLKKYWKSLVIKTGQFHPLTYKTLLSLGKRLWYKYAALLKISASRSHGTPLKNFCRNNINVFLYRHIFSVFSDFSHAFLSNIQMPCLHVPFCTERTDYNSISFCFIWPEFTYSTHGLYDITIMSLTLHNPLPELTGHESLLCVILPCHDDKMGIV